jgi:hypothetical protein
MNELPIFLQFNRTNDYYSVFLSTNQDHTTRWNSFHTKEQIIGYVSRITYIPLATMFSMFDDIYPYSEMGIKMLFLKETIRTNWKICMSNDIYPET